MKNTIKDDERDRTSKNLKNIPNIPIKSSTQITSILSNSSNKVWLQQLIEMKLKKYNSTTVKEVIQCTDLSAKNLFTGINIDEFGLNHVEADTVIFSICNKIHEYLYPGSLCITKGLWGTAYQEKKNIYVDSRTLSITAMTPVIIQLHVRLFVTTTVDMEKKQS